MEVAHKLKQVPPTVEYLTEMLTMALRTKQLKFTRSMLYAKKQAKPGHTFYKIKYVIENRVIYNGAFEMKISVENKLTPDQRIKLLIHLLAQQLTL